jgi:hypothetical protein
MSTPRGPVRSTAIAVAALLVATLAGCGDADEVADPGPSADATTESPAVGAADGDWLIRFSTAEGADGEQSRPVYVRYNPTTGAAAVRALPKVTASDAGPDDQALLNSADHTRAILDTGIPSAQRASGELPVYGLDDEDVETLDIRAITAVPTLRPVAWAFDPVAADVLRVIGSDRTVWKVDLATRTATQESRLPRREGWIFGNGFDKNTGTPYIESIDSDETEPAGNGDSDVRPVERQGGTLIRYDGADLPGLPKPPCGFAGGFQFDDGTAWLFCADTPSISAYRVEEGGDAWEAFGVPSPDVVPAAAADLGVVLPPVS